MRKCSGKILAAVLTGFALASAVSAGTLAADTTAQRPRTLL